MPSRRMTTPGGISRRPPCRSRVSSRSVRPTGSTSPSASGSPGTGWKRCPCLSDGRRITGVVDWANALYGDHLYDVAWLDWWFAKNDHWDAVALLRARHGAAMHFRERIACYECYIGLDDLRFYAKTGRRAQYEW